MLVVLVTVATAPNARCDEGAVRAAVQRKVKMKLWTNFDEKENSVGVARPRTCSWPSMRCGWKRHSGTPRS